MRAVESGTGSGMPARGGGGEGGFERGARAGGAAPQASAAARDDGARAGFVGAFVDPSRPERMMAAVNPLVMAVPPAVRESDSTPDPEPHGVGLYQRERDRLFAIAYRLLGAVQDAEDVVQEAYVRWHRVDPRDIENPPAFLTLIVRRLSLNVLQRADRRRMSPAGLVLPEPATSGEEPDALALHERLEGLSAGIALLLKRLTPPERAVFLLRECFGYSYAELALLLGRSKDYCRQIDLRARRHLHARGSERPVSAARHQELLERFSRAARCGAVGGLVSLLVEEARAYSLRRSGTGRPWTATAESPEARVPVSSGGSAA